MDTKYGIFKYSTNNFFAYISYQTDTPLSSIKQKSQIIYLDNYLKKLNSKTKVFVYENEYIDRHYLEDYSSYYVQCFKSYRKTCSRIHFFEIDEDSDHYKDVADYNFQQALRKDFQKALNGEPSSFQSDNYLGYIVIRPIPHTFLAKVCLKPFVVNDKGRTKYSILKEYEASLFGINLKVNSVAFQEQDKILSACATTSLWSFFHAHPYKNELTLPSSSSITRSAYPKYNGSHREFPNSGLSTDMIRRSLRTYELTPENFDFSDGKNIDLLKEYIHAYCSSGLPAILGVSVDQASCLSSECSGQNTEKELHAITVLGYALKKELVDSPLISHNLSSLYVHDDRYGPFMKIEFEDKVLSVVLSSNKDVTSLNSYKSETYLPDTLIIGVYHKVRIPYIKIKKTCIRLQTLLEDYLSYSTRDNEAKVINALKWDIKIQEVKDFKHDILNSNIESKELYLTKSWPKYLWTATAYYGNISLFTLIFDATDLDHGDVFLDIIPTESKYSNGLINTIETYSNMRYSNKIKRTAATEVHNNYMWGILKYFRKKDSYISTLSDMYGYLKIPEKIKKEELENDEIVSQWEARLYKENDSDGFTLRKDISASNYTYIWVIDIDGFLIIGKEKKGSSMGHPTLTDGMPARIGGELHYNDSKNLWEVNPRSGRYSGDYTDEERRIFLDNVIKYKFSLYFPNEKFI